MERPLLSKLCSELGISLYRDMDSGYFEEADQLAVYYIRKGTPSIVLNGKYKLQDIEIRAICYGIAMFTYEEFPPKGKAYMITQSDVLFNHDKVGLFGHNLFSLYKKRLAEYENERKETKMNELIKINTDNADRPTVMGRKLHEALEIKARYTDWFKRMCEYGFTENSDFILVTQKCETNNPKNPYTTITDHQLTLDMAKEICMIQRSEIGRKCRQYFIEVEKQWNTPEAVMDRALKYADRKIKQLEAERQNAPISAQQLSTLRDEIQIKAIDLCGSGRLYNDIGPTIRLAIMDELMETMNVDELSCIMVWQFDKSVELCRLFKPAQELREFINKSRLGIKGGNIIENN